MGTLLLPPTVWRRADRPGREEMTRRHAKQPRSTLVSHFAASLLQRLPKNCGRITPRLLQTPWAGLSIDEQESAIRAAFLSGVASSPNVSTFARTSHGDPRRRAFRLGQAGTPRPLHRLLLDSWTALDDGERVLAGDYAEWVGGLARGDTSVTVPLIEWIARLPLGPYEEPLGDPRIRALERAAQRPLSLEAALHRLGLTGLDVEDERPRVASEPLLSVAVGALRQFARNDQTWRSFPGIWVPLLYPGMPTRRLCFRAPDGPGRRNPANFAGAWVALACDCFVFSATCGRRTPANLAAIAGAALLALAPLDDKFMCRTRLHVVDDVARLRRRGCLVSPGVRKVARRVSEGLLHASEPSDEREILHSLDWSALRFSERRATAHVTVLKQKRRPKERGRELEPSDLAALDALRRTQAEQAAEVVGLRARLEEAMDRLGRLERLAETSGAKRTRREPDIGSAPGFLLDQLRKARGNPTGRKNGAYVSDAEWRTAATAAGLCIAQGYRLTSAVDYLNKWLKSERVPQRVSAAARGSSNKGFTLRDLPQTSEG